MNGCKIEPRYICKVALPHNSNECDFYADSLHNNGECIYYCLGKCICPRAQTEAMEAK